MLTITRDLANNLKKIVLSTTHINTMHTGQVLHCSKPEKIEEEDPAISTVEQKNDANDRRKVIPVETSMRYLKSNAYKQTYGEQFVWEQYRRNHKGMFAPRKTRKTCIRQGQIATGNPCPICRDEYLVLDHRNTELLKQFISPQSGEVLSYSKTGLCQKQHFKLNVAVELAKDCGLLTYDVPFREYDYSEYCESNVTTNTNN